MTDRATGTIYWLTDGGSDGHGNQRLSITTPLPADWSTSIHGPNDGPYIDTLGQQVRLFIRDGHLGFEVYVGSELHQANPITRRTGVTRDAWKIIGVQSIVGRIRYEQVLSGGSSV